MMEGNYQQIERIKHIHTRLQVLYGLKLTLDAVALEWIARYAEKWRKRH